MDRKQQLDIYKELDDKLIKVSESKGNDYADKDVLSNFKCISEAARLLKINPHTPTGYALFMVILKLGRIGNLLDSNKNVMNESLLDSFEDGIYYFKLAVCCKLEEKLEGKI